MVMIVRAVSVVVVVSSQPEFIYLLLSICRERTWPSTKKSDDGEEFFDDRTNQWLHRPAGDSACRDPPARGCHTGFICVGSLQPMRAAGERPEFDIRPPLGNPRLIVPRGHIQKTFPHGNTSAKNWWFKIRTFPLLGKLPMAIEPHLPVCQLYRWQLDPIKCSLPTTKSIDPIMFTALRLGFPMESRRPAKCGLA